MFFLFNFKLVMHLFPSIPSSIRTSIEQRDRSGFTNSMGKQILNLNLDVLFLYLVTRLFLF